MTNFSKTRRPPKDKCFEFRPNNLAFIRLMTGSQKDKRRALPPIDISQIHKRDTTNLTIHHHSRLR